MAEPRLVPMQRCISGDFPHDWSYKESFTLLAPDGQANVIFSSEPLDPTVTMKEYVTRQGDLLHTEFPEYREHGLEPWSIKGAVADVWRREFTWTPPEGVAVIQVQLYTIYPGRGFTATATTPEVRYDDFRAVFDVILSSLVIDAAASAAIANAQEPAGSSVDKGNPHDVPSTTS